MPAQGIQIGQVSVFANSGMKPNSKAFTVNVLVKIEEVDFNAPGLSLHHRTIPDVQHSIEPAPGVVGSYRIDTLRRYQLIRGFDAIARADAMLKGIEGGIQEPRMIMELLVLELAK